jgi:hypothetical protein
VVATHAVAPVTANPGADITDIEVLADGRVLLSLYNVLAGPVAGARLAWLDLASGAVTAVSSPVPGPVVNALAADASGSTLYLGVWSGLTGGTVWKMPLRPLAPPSQLSPALPGGIYALAANGAGELFVGTNGSTGSNPYGTPPNLHRVDPGSGAVTDLHTAQRGVRLALTIERNTGRIVTVGGGGGQRVAIEDGAGGLMTLAAGMLGGWGVPAGMAILPAVEEYARAAVGNPPHRWSVDPNPGGLPTVGNGGFSLTLDCPSPAPAALVLAPAAAAPANIGGFVPVVDLRAPSLLVLPWMVRQGANTIGLGIPGVAAYEHVSVFLQSFHLEPAGPASSPGARVTIL